MHPNPTHTTRASYLLPPRLRILSPKTTASVCPVTFSFPLRLVLLVRPAQHRDHSFLFCFCFVRLKCCIPLCICFESVRAPRPDTRLFWRAVSVCDVLAELTSSMASVSLNHSALLLLFPSLGPQCPIWPRTLSSACCRWTRPPV